MGERCNSLKRSFSPIKEWEEVFDLLEDIANYEYQWHLSQHNVQQHRDPLEDQIQASMEQSLNDEPSLPKVEQEASPIEPKECALPIISISPQHTPRRAKKLFFQSIPSYREVPSFVDSLDTWPPIIFKPTFFCGQIAKSCRLCMQLSMEESLFLSIYFTTILFYFVLDIIYFSFWFLIV